MFRLFQFLCYHDLFYQANVMGGLGESRIIPYDLRIVFGNSEAGSTDQWCNGKRCTPTNVDSFLSPSGSIRRNRDIEYIRCIESLHIQSSMADHEGMKGITYYDACPLPLCVVFMLSQQKTLPAVYQFQSYGFFTCFAIIQ